MPRPSLYWMAACCGLAVCTASGQRGSAQQPSGAPSGAVTPRADIYPTLDDAFLRWPLPAGAERYGAPAGDLGAFFRGVPGGATSEFYHYFHTDQETPDAVPWTGLEATTRAYAKIIDEVNKLALRDLQRPEVP